MLLVVVGILIWGLIAFLAIRFAVRSNKDKRTQNLRNSLTFLPVFALIFTLLLFTLMTSAMTSAFVEIQYQLIDTAVSDAENACVQYLASDRTEENWEQLVMQCNKSNELVKKAEDKNNFWLNWATISSEDYSIVITEDEILLPDLSNTRFAFAANLSFVKKHKPE